MPASPFQASGETSPGKNDDLPRTIAGSTPLPLGRRSFAVSGPLAPVRSASYPVPVRRLTGSFHASFSVRLTTNALRFPSVPATRFREDFHLQVIAHAGPTTGSRGSETTHGSSTSSDPDGSLVRPFILNERLEHPLFQALRHSTAILGPSQGLHEVFFELDARIASLADLQMASDLLLGHALELTPNIQRGGRWPRRRGSSRRPFHRPCHCCRREPCRRIGRPGRCRRTTVSTSRKTPLVVSPLRDVPHLEGIVVEPALELSASTKEPTLHGSDGDLHDLGDLPIGKIL